MGVAEPLKDALPLLDEEAPLVTEAVDDTDTVLLAVRVEVGVAAGVPLLVAVGELDGVPELVCVAVAELLRELEPVLEADAPDVKEAVGDTVTVPLPLTVLLGVHAPVPLPEGVAVPVAVPLPVCDPVGAAESETLAV